MNSNPIHVIALAETLPDHQAEITQMLVSLAHTAREEKGCQRYEVFCDANNPHLLSTLEEWSDEDALQTHLQSPHVVNALQEMAGKLAVPPQIRILRPLEGVPV